MECGPLVNGTFLDINGETSQFMRLLSKNCSVCRESLRSDRERFLGGRDLSHCLF